MRYLSLIKYKLLFLVVIVCSTLLLIRYSYPFPFNVYGEFFGTHSVPTDGNEDDHNNLINIGFSNFDFEQAKLHESGLQDEYDLTAVLLHWKRLEGVQTTVQYLLNTHLFKQIIVWNNNPHVNLTVHHLIDHHRSTNFVRIINSKDNLKDQAKYRACTEAKTRACFYVDDDWNVSHYLKSLIASFRSDPYLLHTVTDPYTFYTNLIWTYFDSSIDLHSGFSWIGCGSLFLREHAERHLQFIHKYLRNHTDLIAFSDVFFSLWLNDIPVQFNTNLHHQRSKRSNRSVSFSLTPRFAHLQYTSSILAIRILENSLRFDLAEDIEVNFSHEQNRRFPSYVKSPSLNDDLIFYTNVLPYDIKSQTFNIVRDFQRGTRRNLPQHPNVKYFSQHSTWKAVDGDRASCWHSHREIYFNDFYALDFLSIQSNLTFTVAVAHSPKIQINLDVSISLDGLRWLSYRSQHGIYTKYNRTVEEHLHTFLFDAREFNRGFQSFRYISFKAMRDSDHHFHVCEIQIITKVNRTSTMLDFL